jgi:UDP-N-acetyl-D-mannosaminuronic acid dehydrogenase
MSKKICVLGLGYIGLPTASFLGTKGYQVLGVDVNSQVVDKINRGQIHIVEPDLDILVKSAVLAGNLKAAMAPEPADVFIIAVPTPFGRDKQPDLHYVESAVRSILPVLAAGNLVILESTSPAGTTENIVARIIEEAGFNTESDVFVAHCPERVLPGRVLIELVENDRIVGGINRTSTQVAADFYRAFVNGEVLETTASTAELAKLAENSFRDVNIAYANELSLVCAELGVDVWELIRLANRHPRVNILQPGPGVGGHCIAVDPWFIVSSCPERTPLIRTAREVNDYKPQWVVEQVTRQAEKFKAPKIACLGLSFKADIDDLRESPAVWITQELIRRNVGELLIVEPNVKAHPEFDLVSVDVAIQKADIVLVLVDHKQFKRLSPAFFREKILIDTRGCIQV